MCFTGLFAVAMMLEPAVTTAVASQPGTPLALTAHGQR